MRRVRVALATALLLTLVMAGSARAADPLTCEGYPEPRIFLETQDWWFPIPGLSPERTGHMHLGICMPTGEVSGVVQFDYVVTRHDNLVKLTKLKMQDDTSKSFILDKVNVPPAGGDDQLVFTYNVDTRLMLDGVRQFRAYAFGSHANGAEQIARASWPLDVENGKADKNKQDPDQFRYLNWYKLAGGGDTGYVGPVITRVDADTYQVACKVNGGPSVSHSFVHIDPDFHAGDPGTVLVDKAGAFSGTVDVPTGASRLVVRCQQDLPGSDVHEGVGSMAL